MSIGHAPRVCSAAAHATEELIFAGPDSILVGWLPLHHAMGLMVQVIAPATSGAQIVLTTTEQFQRRPMSWLQLISDHRATLSLAGNFAFALCVQFATDEQVAALDLSSLKVLRVGQRAGAPGDGHGVHRAVRVPAVWTRPRSPPLSG